MGWKWKGGGVVRALDGTVKAARSALERFREVGGPAVKVKGLKRLKTLGLKSSRIREWLAVIDEEAQNIGFQQVWHMIRGLLFPKVTSRAWRARVRACYSCPIYDMSLKRCRPYTGSTLGCGCYTPYRLMDPSPCLRETLKL